jgi:hypothetical protein
VTVTYIVTGTIAVGRGEAVTGETLDELSARRVCMVAALSTRSAAILLKASGRVALTSCADPASRRM